MKEDLGTNMWWLTKQFSLNRYKNLTYSDGGEFATIKTVTKDTLLWWRKRLPLKLSTFSKDTLLWRRKRSSLEILFNGGQGYPPLSLTRGGPTPLQNSIKNIKVETKLQSDQ